MLTRLLTAACVLVMATGMTTVATAHAETAAAAPVVVSGHVRLAEGRAVLERAGARWTRVATVMVRHHTFSVSTQQAHTVDHYRLRFRHGHSRTFAASTDGSAARIVQSAPAQSCSTTPITKPDGTPWVCTFDDEFSGTSLDTTKWMAQTAFASGSSAAYACYTARSSNVSVSGGSLNLTARKETTPITCADPSLGTTYYSAGSVTSYHLFSQEYGRFEARIKTSSSTAPGLQESFWLWPDDRYDTSGTTWPAAGEIDVAETYSQYPGLAVPYLHYTANDNGGPIPGTNTAWNCAAQRGVYNTYTLTWTATSIEVDVNGKTCLVNTSANPAFNKRYILDLSALLGNGTNALTSATVLPATTSVDYVRVWR